MISDYTVTEKDDRVFCTESDGASGCLKSRGLASACRAGDRSRKSRGGSYVRRGGREVPRSRNRWQLQSAPRDRYSQNHAGIYDRRRRRRNVDIAVISLGGAVVNTSIKVAGDDFDEAIVRYMRKSIIC